MAMEYTEEQLNNFDKTTLVQLFLVQRRNFVTLIRNFSYCWNRPLF